MLKKAPFVHKFLRNLDRLDRESVRNYVLDLADENSLYQEILDCLEEGVLLLTREGQIQYLNRQASLLLGLDNVEAKLKNLAGLLKDSELNRFLSEHLKSLAEGLARDITLLSPREMRLRISLSPMDKMILMILDRKKMIAGDDERRARIEGLVSLAAGIAHEIGNPLNSITIHLQLLKKEAKGLTDSKRRIFEKTIEVLQNETARLDKIVRNFLKATRMPPLRLRSDDLNSVLEQALEFMNPELKRQGVRIEFEPFRALPLFLMDRERLYQAFINLIKNAMEAMPGGGNLKIRIAQKDKVALVTFKDGGSGIAEEDKPHIFETYYTTKEEGSGLGLVSVFNAVRDHGGRIEVASKVGKGTRVTLLLPMRQPNLQLPQFKSK